MNASPYERGKSWHLASRAHGNDDADGVAGLFTEDVTWPARGAAEFFAMGAAHCVQVDDAPET